MPRFTRAAEDACVDQVALSGSIVQGARSAGVSRQAVYDRMSADHAFKGRMLLAKDAYYDRLLAAARQRAFTGVEEPLLKGGSAVQDEDGQPVRIRKYSDRLLLFLLRRTEAADDDDS